MLARVPRRNTARSASAQPSCAARPTAWTANPSAFSRPVAKFFFPQHTQFVNTRVQQFISRPSAPPAAWRRSLATKAAPAVPQEAPVAAAAPASQLQTLDLTDAIIDSIRFAPGEAEINQQGLAVGIDAFGALKDSFAVVQIGGHQYKVTEGDEIMVNKIDSLDLQTQILLDKVLLLGTKKLTAIGTPLLPNVRVLAQVEEQALARKVIVFKKKRRHGYKRHRGHRQPYTLLRILDIVVKKP